MDREPQSSIQLRSRVSGDTVVVTLDDLSDEERELIPGVILRRFGTHISSARFNQESTLVCHVVGATARYRESIMQTMKHRVCQAIRATVHELREAQRHLAAAESRV